MMHNHLEKKMVVIQLRNVEIDVICCGHYSVLGFF